MSEQITVTFKKNYSATRGLAIAGKKGDTMELPACEQVAQLLEDGTLVAEKGGAAKREKATKKANEES